MPRQNDVLRKLQKLDQRVHMGKAKTGKGRLRSWEVIPEAEKN